MARDAGRETAAGDLAEAQIHAIRDPSLVETRRGQILDASLALFLEKGYAATTIRDICAGSGVNQASLYDYIANKPDILRRLLNRLWFARDTEGLADQLAQARETPVGEILKAYYRVNWKAKRDGILLAYRSVPHLTVDDKRLLREREERVIGDISERIAARTGAPAASAEVRTIANFMIFLNAFGPFREWLMRDGEEDAALEMIGAAVDAMIARLAERGGS